MINENNLLYSSKPAFSIYFSLKSYFREPSHEFFEVFTWLAARHEFIEKQKKFPFIISRKCHYKYSNMHKCLQVEKSESVRKENDNENFTVDLAIFCLLFFIGIFIIRLLLGLISKYYPNKQQCFILSMCQ